VNIIGHGKNSATGERESCEPSFKLSNTEMLAYRSFRMIHQRQPADPGERARRGTARGGILVLLDDPCGVDLRQPA
jgi:hypothetical protein